MSLEDEIRRIVREEVAKLRPANDQSEYLSVAEAAKHAPASPERKREG